MAFGGMGAGRRFGALGDVSKTAFSSQGQAFFRRLSTQPSASRKFAYDTLIKSLVSAGIWSSLDALYLFAAADQATALTNLVQSSYAATAISGPTFTTDRGFTGNGTTSYINSGFNPSAGGTQFSQNSATLAGWSLTSAASAKTQLIGTEASTAGSSRLLTRTVGDSAFARTNFDGTNQIIVTVSDGSGLFSMVRSSSSQQDFYQNGSSIGTISTGSSSLTATSVYFLRSVTNFAVNQIAVGLIGSSLSAANQLILYNALRAYMTTVGVP